MADLVIRGMEMPKEGNWKTVRIYPDGTCAAPYWTGDCKVLDCTAVPLPEKHGRLIDADEISGSLAESATFNYNKRTSVCWSDVFLSMIDMLDEVPTIVPAEGGPANV